MKQETYNRRLSEATIGTLETYMGEIECEEVRQQVRAILDNPVVGELAEAWEVRDELRAVCDYLKQDADNRLTAPAFREVMIRDRRAMLADLEYGARW
jgi:hypothetical protein